MSSKDNSLLMLCHKITDKVSIGGWFASEKLDGQRCFWDGGITVGMKVQDVPWANKYDKRKQGMLSTGLWSRLGNIIHAPDWWTAGLPNVMLDGELWQGYAHRQVLMSAIKQEIPDNRWEFVRFMVYDLVPASRFLSTRTVTYSGRKQDISIPDWATRFGTLQSISYGAPFLSRLDVLMSKIILNQYAKVLHQIKLPIKEVDARSRADQLMNIVLEKGGEGLVLKKPEGIYECQRSHGCLKVKPFEDGEGTVIGWYSGKETDKGSKLLGMMGSLILKLDNGKELQLSGFTDEERRLGTDAETWARLHPGEKAPKFSVGMLHFTEGLVVSFKYRGLTADGIPMEARYWRTREDE